MKDEPPDDVTRQNNKGPDVLSAAGRKLVQTNGLVRRGGEPQGIHFHTNRSIVLEWLSRG